MPFTVRDGCLSLHGVYADQMQTLWSGRCPDSTVSWIIAVLRNWGRQPTALERSLNPARCFERLCPKFARPPTLS